MLTTSFSRIVDVESIYLHDTRRDLPDQVMEGEQGWIVQGILSRALFHRPPLSGQKTFTVLSPHESNIYAQKRGVAKKLIFTIRAIMVGQQIDVVAGDFSGTAWRCSNRDNISTLDDALRIANATGPLTTVGTRINSQQLGRRLWIPQATRFGSLLESAHARCVLRPTQNSRSASHRSKLPSRDMAPPGFRRLAQHSFTAW